MKSKLLINIISILFLSLQILPAKTVKKETKIDIQKSSEKNNIKAKDIKNKDEKKKEDELKEEEKRKKKLKEDKEKQEKSEKRKIEWIEKTVKFGTSKERKEAINFIPTIKDKDKKNKTVANLIKTMKTEKDATVLQKAITILSDLKAKNAIPLFKSGLDHESEDVRIVSVYALKDLDGKEAEEKIIRILKKQDLSKESNFTEGLIVTLGKFESKAITDYAIEKLQGDELTKNLRLKFLILLGENKDPKAIPYLEKLFNDPDEDLAYRSYAINSLGKMGYKKIVPDLNKILNEIDNYSFKKKSKYYNFQIYCVAALAKMGDKSAYPRLIDSLKSDSAAIRLRAIKFLNELKDKRSIDILKYKAEYDPDLKVQKEAKKSLKENFNIDLDKEKVKELIGKLESSEKDRLNILWKLSSMKNLKDNIEESSINALRNLAKSEKNDKEKKIIIKILTENLKTTLNLEVKPGNNKPIKGKVK